jgi:hypothetical protein
MVNPRAAFMMSICALAAVSLGQFPGFTVPLKQKQRAADTAPIVERGPGVPINDECLGPTPITCGESIATLTHIASTNPSDPNFACAFGGPRQGVGSTWFSFVATAARATITTTYPGPTLPNGASPDTLLSVYSGTCGSLSQIACNDDIDFGANNFLSSITLSTLTVGQTYIIEVAAYDLATVAPYGLVVTDCRAGNDECSDAAELTCGQTADVDLAFTTINPADPVFSCRSGDACDPGANPQLGVNSAWFRFTATTPGVVLSITDPDGGGLGFNDTLLAVYEGGCGSLTEIACNDDIDCQNANFLSRIELGGLIAGLTYHIQLAKWEPKDENRYRISLECTCGLVCPHHATTEPEPCGEDLNSGCFQMSTGTTPVSLGEVICGTSPSNAKILDYDVYSFTCSRPTSIQFVTLAAFDTNVAVLDDGCQGNVTYAVAFPLACDLTRLSALLPPATYQAGLVNFDFGQDCGFDSGYLACVTIAPACPGDANGDGFVSFADVTSTLTFFNYNYNPFPGVGEGDANSDGVVNFADVTSVLQVFGADCFHVARPEPAAPPADSRWTR